MAANLLGLLVGELGQPGADLPEMNSGDFSRSRILYRPG